MKLGKLYLLPNTLGEGNAEELLSLEVRLTAQSLSYFIGEEAKNARRFLKEIKHTKPISELNIELFNEHSKAEDAQRLIQPALDGHDIGLISDAGCPIIADPGSEIVRAAHFAGITVRPLAGPSSIILALMASGFSGQRFSFCGYLSKDQKERRKQIQDLERISKNNSAAQIFIETPYRNEAVFQDILSVCAEYTGLSIAQALGSQAEKIISLSIKKWRQEKFIIEKLPTVFVISVS